MKKHLTIIGIILSTVVLAVLSVLTAIRIKNLGTEPIAPNAPASQPKAVEETPDAPPIGSEPENASCKTSFTADEVTGVTCVKEVYRDDERNTPGSYLLITASDSGEEVNNKLPGGAEVEKGEKVVYRIVTENPDNKPSTISDVLPEGVTFVDAVEDCSYTAATRTVSCQANSTTELAFRVSLDEEATGTITNTASIVSGSEEPSTCSVSINVAATPSSTPTPTSTVTPKPSVTPTVTPGPTATPGPEPLCEYLHADPTGGPVPLTVSFEGKGFDPVRVKGFRFTFGDGEEQELLDSFASSQIETVEHTYSHSGTYEAKLEIMDDGDHWRTRTECEVSIVVDAPNVTTVQTVQKTSPTEAELPVAGIKIPTLGGIIFSFLLISIGAALVF